MIHARNKPLPFNTQAPTSNLTLRSKTRAWLYSVCTFIEAIIKVGVEKFGTALGYSQSPSWERQFLKLFLLQILHRQPTLRITCADRSDGAGAQAHTMMAAITFAKAYGHDYVHTPFQKIDHNDKSIPNWSHAWESLFNLGTIEQSAVNEITAGSKNPVNYSYFHPKFFYRISNFLHGRVFNTGYHNRPASGQERTFEPFFYFADSHPDAFEAVIPKFQKTFRAGQPRSAPGVLQVAVHMRRGDVTPEMPRRYTPLSRIIPVLESVKLTLEVFHADYEISLYSQGDLTDFCALQEWAVNFHLDEDPVWTMQQLVAADILIMSRSSFSYVAALLSEGIKLYEPFWHAPLSSWIVRRSSGRFNVSKFRGELDRLLEHRKQKGRATVAQ